VDADPIDPDVLLMLARSHQDPEARARLVDQISTILLTHSPCVRLQAAEILISLLPRLEERVRAHLARRLAASADVPHELICRLARDVIGVAYPILLDSPVLTEDDLVAIIASHGVDHRLAIAQRSDLSEIVTTALVIHGPEDVIEKTLQNPSARFSAETLRTVARLARQIKRLQGPLATRPDLPSELAQEILAFVSQEVRSAILQRLHPKIVRFGNPDPALVAEISAAIDRRRPVDGALLLATLRGGAGHFFDSLLATAIGAPVDSIRNALSWIPHRILPAAAILLGLSPTQLSYIWLHFCQAYPAVAEKGVGIVPVLSTYGALTRETAERHLRALLRMSARRRHA